MDQRLREELIARYMATHEGRILLIQSMVTPAEQVVQRAACPDFMAAFRALQDVKDYINIAHEIERRGTPFFTSSVDSAREFEDQLKPSFEAAMETVKAHEEGPNLLLVWEIMES